MHLSLSSPAREPRGRVERQWRPSATVHDCSPTAPVHACKVPENSFSFVSLCFFTGFSLWTRKQLQSEFLASFEKAHHKQISEKLLQET
ncbi:unnamed protein product [Urochloa humidicola]